MGTADTTNADTTAQREADEAADKKSKETWSQMADRLETELGGWAKLFTWILRLLGSFMDPEEPAKTPTVDTPSGGRTLTQEITDVTTALGVRGQSGALQDNALSDDEKASLKTEIEQVRSAIPGTMTDEVRASITGMLAALREGGVEDADSILGQSVTGLRTAVQPARSQ